jgi:hypothetical protein
MATALFTRQARKVSLIPLKNTVRAMIPVNSLYRKLILSEPDELPYEEGISKLEAYSKVLTIEFAKRATV